MWGCESFDVVCVLVLPQKQFGKSKIKTVNEVALAGEKQSSALSWINIVAREANRRGQTNGPVFLGPGKGDVCVWGQNQISLHVRGGPFK